LIWISWWMLYSQQSYGCVLSHIGLLFLGIRTFYGNVIEMELQAPSMQGLFGSKETLRRIALKTECLEKYRSEEVVLQRLRSWECS
jgi:hypothetical protein